MKLWNWFIRGCLVLLAGVSAWAGDSVTEARAAFLKPSRDFSNGPLWVWNDRLTEEQIQSTLRDLASQQIKQVWVHPRPGLMTPYLSPEWFHLWKVALKEAKRLDMNVWIYDENSYPSGFAGGWVPELMPESRGMGLRFREEKEAPKWSEELVAVLRVDNGVSTNVTEAVKAGAALAPGRYLAVRLEYDAASPWHGNRWYVNLLTPGVTEKFLEVTLEPYRKQLGREFGGRIPGVFTDEPNIRPAGELPWSPVLAGEFRKRWGYELTDHLASLVWQVGDWRKVRHNYFQVLHEQFVERWAKPYYEYCRTNHLEFTGHYWDHEWPNCVGVPDNMGMAAWQQRPGIDCLMNQYREDTHAQFGNLRMVRELASVANQMGRPRTLCEIYGAGGWDLRFEDMKRIGDWLQVLGVNTLNEHLSYVTLRGARKRDHPQSFSYHEPWWADYHLLAGYFARLSAALSQGRQVNRVLVVEPTTTAWMYQREGAALQGLADPFVRLLHGLDAAQVEYDLGSEDILARHGRVVNGRLQVGEAAYDHVVLPPGTENLNRTTDALLAEMAARVTGEAPSRIDGAVASAKCRPGVGVSWRDPGAAEQVVRRMQELQRATGFYVERAPGDAGNLFHHRRELAGGEILFLVNTSAEHGSRGVVVSRQPAIEQWDLATGETRPYAYARTGHGVSARFELPPSGSLLLMLGGKSGPGPVATSAHRTITGAGPVQARRAGPNVLTLDYADITAGGKSLTNAYTYRANQFAWKQNGMDRNPWDSAVQFKDELIRRTFPAGSGFVAEYHFTIRGPVPGKLEVVIERPDLYAVAFNGQPVKAGSGWWLDKAFRRVDVARLARAGTNTLRLSASPFTMYHELEPVYVLGDFGLEPAEEGFVIVPPQALRLGEAARELKHGVAPDGTMWLTRGVGFQSEGGRPVEDRAPFVVFDAGRRQDITGLRIWNYAEQDRKNLTARGAKRIRVTAAPTLEGLQGGKDAGKLDLGTFTLTEARGAAVAQSLALKANGVRFVRIDILENWQGTVYPVTGEPKDNGHTGLAEVRLVSGGREVRNVKVAACSSELTSMDRGAAQLVNGSGLALAGGGWNEQGLPFYAEGVAYTQEFALPEVKGRYVLQLGDWLGSVARVRVNGRDAGRVYAPPYECDVTSRLRKGRNQIEVTVVGTLKNTLGPHHAGTTLGTAWPRHFHQGPEHQPPGQAYDLVGYGLFEPFRLEQRTPGELEIAK